MNCVRSVLAFALIVSVGAVCYSGSLYGRITASLSHSRQCIYDLVSGQISNASVVVTGSSRARQSVDSRQLARGLGQVPDSAFNVSHPNNNPWLDLLFVKHAIKSQRLKLIVVEAQVGSSAARRIDAEANGRSDAARETVALASGVQAKAAIAALDAQLLTRLMDREPSAMLRIYDALYVAKYKLEIGLKTLLSTRVLRQLVFGYDDIISGDPTTCLPKRSNASKAGTPKQMQVRARRTEAFFESYPGGWTTVPDDAGDFLSDPETALDRSAMKEIVAFARSKSVTVVFFYLPSLYSPPPSNEFASAFAREIGARLLLPDRTTLSRLHHYYYDATHLNLDGRRMFTEWLLGELGAEAKI